MTARELLVVAEARAKVIVARRDEVTAGPIVSESLYQYATGMVGGAMEVVRVLVDELEKAEATDTPGDTS